MAGLSIDPFNVNKAVQMGSISVRRPRRMSLEVDS